MFSKTTTENGQGEPFTEYYGMDIFTTVNGDVQDNPARTLQRSGSADVSSGGQQPARASRRAARRRYSEYHSSEDEDGFDENVDVTKLTPDAQRRVKRRIANRECARRIRQRKMNLMQQLNIKVEELQEMNAMLLQKLACVTTRWRDICRDNCAIRADLLLARSLRATQGKSSEDTLRHFQAMVLAERGPAPEAPLPVLGEPRPQSVLAA